jgi:hypothetical protein
MSLHRAYLGQLIIPISTNASNVLGAKELAMAAAIVFVNASAYTGTISVKVGKDEGSLISTHQPLDNNGTAVTLTAARTQRHEVNGFESLSLASSGTEAAERIVDVYSILSLNGG